VHMIGSTPTAILGALEPVAAVAIGILVFDETMTLPLATGIMLILSAVILIVLGKANTN
jgi:drug/metabolite transporter (DMT)-like permease